MDHYNYFVPNINGFNFSFPFFQSDSQNMCVMIPSLNPVAVASFNSPGQKNDDNSVPEEIFPDFRCKECSVSIPTYSEFRAHLSTHDVKANEITVESSSPDFERTMPRHNDYISILQPLKRGAVNEQFGCPKKFRFSPEPADHVNGHRIKTRDISCWICRSAFASIQSLRKHVKMNHCGNKSRRQCPYCTYRCFQSSDMDKHIARRHTKDFKYKCLHCVKGFVTPKELKNHERRKHFDLWKLSARTSLPDPNPFSFKVNFDKGKFVYTPRE